MPTHMTGATAGSASRLAGRLATDACPKWCIRSGAVESVAETESDTASARMRGSPAKTRRSP